MEATFQTTSMMEVQMEGAELAHKTPPRVPPKPTSKSPTQPSLFAKVTGGRQQSLSPVRHVKAPTPTPVRWVKPSYSDFVVVSVKVCCMCCRLLSQRL